MRDYGRIYTSFWTHPTIKGFGADGRTLAAYLLTCQHSNAIGCYPLAPLYAVHDLSLADDPWTVERVSKAFDKLSETGWAYRFNDCETVCVTEYIDPWNLPENPNVLKRMIKLLDLLPKDPLRAYPVKAILGVKGKRGEDWLSPPERRRLETLYQTLWEGLPKQFRNPNLSEPIRTLPFPSDPKRGTEPVDNSVREEPEFALEGNSGSSHQPSREKPLASAVSDHHTPPGVLLAALRSRNR